MICCLNLCIVLFDSSIIFCNYGEIIDFLLLLLILELFLILYVLLMFSSLDLSTIRENFSVERLKVHITGTI